MKCAEINNLIIEATDLDEIIQESGFQMHLKSCKVCQAKLELEKKVRMGFAAIANEAPPANLLDSILSIQEIPETVSFWEKVQRFFFSFTFKVAFASCVTGFVLALALSHYDHIVVMQRNTLIKAEQQTIKNKSFAMKKNVSKDDRQINDKAKDTGLTHESRQNLEEVPTTQALYYVEQDTNVWPEEAEEQVFAKKVDLEVPKARFSIQKAKATSSEPEMKFAMAPRPAMSKTIKKARTAVCRDKSILSSGKLQIEDSFGARIKDDCKEDNEELFVEDARSTDIEQLIIKHNIKVSIGPISLKHWTVQGIITAETYRKLSPPYGKEWFVEKLDNDIKVVLKKH